MEENNSIKQYNGTLFVQFKSPETYLEFKSCSVSWLEETRKLEFAENGYTFKIKDKFKDMIQPLDAEKAIQIGFENLVLKVEAMWNENIGPRGDTKE